MYISMPASENHLEHAIITIKTCACERFLHGYNVKVTSVMAFALRTPMHKWWLEDLNKLIHDKPHARAITNVELLMVVTQFMDFLCKTGLEVSKKNKITVEYEDVPGTPAFHLVRGDGVRVSIPSFFRVPEDLSSFQPRDFLTFLLHESDDGSRTAPSLNLQELCGTETTTRTSNIPMPDELNRVYVAAKNAARDNLTKFRDVLLAQKSAAPYAPLPLSPQYVFLDDDSIAAMPAHENFWSVDAVCAKLMRK